MTAEQKAQQKLKDVTAGEERAEGWGWPPLAMKYHYFRNGKSLCGYWNERGPVAAVAEGGSPYNCAKCKKLALQAGADKAKE